MKAMNLAIATFAIVAMAKPVGAVDLNACATLETLVATARDRYDQAEIANKDPDALCKEDPTPDTCVSEIRAEYHSAEAALKLAWANYTKAGCDVQPLFN